MDERTEGPPAAAAASTAAVLRRHLGSALDAPADATIEWFGARISALSDEVRRLRDALGLDPAATLDARLARAGEIAARARDGDAYRTDLIADALAEGVRALGKDFAREAYAGLVASLPVESIRRIRDDWRAIADRDLKGGRVTVDTTTTADTAAKTDGDARAYAA